MSFTFSAEDVVDSERESQVSLLGRKYLLFSDAKSNATWAAPGPKKIVKCILIENRERFNCKVSKLIQKISQDIF